MSDNNVIKINNGNCITSDSNIACKITCERFYLDLLNKLKNDEYLSQFLSGVDSSSIEANILPIGLRNLSAIKSDVTYHRENYADMRALKEAYTYANKFLPQDDEKNRNFYDRYFPMFLNGLKFQFSRETKDLISQISFVRLTPLLVNILLRKKPDGTDNIVRRLKAKPDSRVEDEEGNISYEYYTEEEVKEAEMKIRVERDAKEFDTLDVNYIEYQTKNIFLSIISMMNVKDDEVDEKTDEEDFDIIFQTNEDDSEILKDVFDYFLSIAKEDFKVLKAIEERGTDIQWYIHNYAGTKAYKKSNTSMSPTKMYVNLMKYVSFIIDNFIDMIELIKNKGTDPNFTDKSIDVLIGKEINEETENMSDMLMEILGSEIDRDFVDSFDFKIDTVTFKLLLINVLKVATENTGGRCRKIIDRFAKHIGLKINGGSAFDKIFDDFSNNFSSISATAIVATNNIISILNGHEENFVSYIYRTAKKLLTNENYAISLAIIDSVVSKVSGKKKDIFYDMSNNNFTLSLDSLIDTCRRITKKEITDNTRPISDYKNQIDAKQLELEQKKKEISEILDEKYGLSFPKFYCDLPKIPYDHSELMWFKVKCADLEELLSDIKKKNPIFDWDSLRSTYRKLYDLKMEFSESSFENPDTVEEINMLQKEYDTMIKETNLYDESIDKYKKYEESLYYYSRPEKIKFKFVNFDFKFKQKLEPKMSYYIGNCTVYLNGTTRSVQSLMKNDGYVNVLKEYFRPMFEPFATINKEVFEIRFEKVERKVKNSRNIAPGGAQSYTDLLMTVIFGSSEDAHICSKFRTKFFTILDSNLLLTQAKLKLGYGDQNVNFSFSDVPQEFRISWARTTEQNLVLTGSKGEKTYKLYDDSRACDEEYPFFDNRGIQAIKSEFDKTYQKYINNVNRMNRQKYERKVPINKVTGEELKFGEETEEARKQKEHNASRWASFVANESIGGSIVKSLSGNNNNDDELIGKQVRRHARGRVTPKTKGGIKHVRNTEEITSVIKYTKKIVRKRIVEEENDGWFTIKRHGKNITGRHVSKNTGDNMDGRKGNRTPKRFRNPLKGNNRPIQSESSRSRTPGSGRGSKGTPVSFGSQNVTPTYRSDTPNSDVRNYDVNSPSISKRSGIETGAKSPSGSSRSASPSFITSNVFFENEGEKDNIFGFHVEDVAPPENVFNVGSNPTSRENTNTSKSVDFETKEDEDEDEDVDLDF